MMTNVDQHDTARTLRSALQRLIVTHGALDDRKRPCGSTLPTPHAWALMALLGGAMTIGELASQLNIDRTNVSRLCGRMESLGEVERVTHPEDARARLIRLTKHGEQVASTIDASSAEHFAAVIQNLGASPDLVVDALVALERALSLVDSE